MNVKQPSRISQEVILPPEDGAVSIWAEVSANDENGISIDGIQKGDTISIEHMSGQCSFSGSGTDIALSVVAVTLALGEDGSQNADVDATATLEALDNELKKIKSNQGDLGSKIRDAWGEKGDSGGKFAKEEGGIVVCMPGTAGSVKSTEDYWLKSEAENKGRGPEYYKPAFAEQDCWFPSRKGTQKLSEVASKNGVVTIHAWDYKFNDNKGVYTIKIVVTRSKNSANHRKLLNAAKKLL